MNIRALRFYILILASGIAAPAVASSRLFTDDAPLKLVITAPFEMLVRTAPYKTDPFAATLSANDGAGPDETFAIQLRARGVSRREVCEFPPLLLEFKDAEVRDTLFKGQEKLKLVTWCRHGADAEQRIVIEYLAYRMFELLTPVSYRVRAAQVTYRKNKGDAGITRFGFLIEDTDDVADRNDLRELRAGDREIAAGQLDPHATARAALFEYLVSNLDFDFLAGPADAACCHNIKLIAARDATVATAAQVVPLPYDFDSSGLVDAPYARAPKGLKVTQRVYRGYCQHNGEIASVITEFQAHQSEMLALVNDEPLLMSKFRTKTARYLDEFFAVLADPARVQREIVGSCR